MNRGKKAAYNSIASLFAEIVAVICGFILPRLILRSFGSSYNGLIQSIGQFLSVVALLRAGVGGATRAALYKTLANKDEEQLSATVRATEFFMRKVALIFTGFVLVFSCLYPLVVKNDFDWIFSSTLVLIISASTFIEYYFGITYHILLQADQRQYISSVLSAFTTVINTAISVILINSGFGIHVVKTGSTVAYCLTPVILHIYAKKHYHINKQVKPDFSSINQRWDAMFHQVAGFIYSNTDVMLINIFLNLNEVSVYTTYCLVSNGIKKMMVTFTSGVEAAFGDMIARDNQALLLENIKLYETLLHGVISVVFGAALILITPFIGVYTNGIMDVNYIRYGFGYLLIITEAIHLLRQPYHSIIEAAGHFKQTKHIAAIQAALNLGTSIVLINIFGLVGVIVGTLVSDLYRGIAYRIYVKKNLLQQIRIVEYIKRFVITTLTMALIYSISKIFRYTEINDYLQWAYYAVKITLGAIIITLLTNICFYKKETTRLFIKLRNIISSIFSKNKGEIGQ